MGIKVLVIDDEAPIRLLCRVNLEAEGMSVLEAPDGSSGLEQARTAAPDVILLDVMMPGLDGHLQRAAVAHSREMLATDVFAHGAFARRMLHFDVKGSIEGENLAWGTGDESTARAIVAAWLASPEHRANLLRRSFRRTGVGDLIGPFQGCGGARVITADFAG